MESSTLIAKARDIATEAHKGQYRWDRVTPYISHPAAVAYSLAGYGEETIAEEVNMKNINWRYIFSAIVSIFFCLVALTSQNSIYPPEYRNAAGNYEWKVILGQTVGITIDYLGPGTVDSISFRPHFRSSHTLTIPPRNPADTWEVEIQASTNAKSTWLMSNSIANYQNWTKQTVMARKQVSFPASSSPYEAIGGFNAIFGEPFIYTLDFDTPLQLARPETVHFTLFFTAAWGIRLDAFGQNFVDDAHVPWAGSSQSAFRLNTCPRYGTIFQLFWNPVIQQFELNQTTYDYNNNNFVYTWLVSPYFPRSPAPTMWSLGKSCTLYLHQNNTIAIPITIFRRYEIFFPTSPQIMHRPLTTAALGINPNTNSLDYISDNVTLKVPQIWKNPITIGTRATIENSWQGTQGLDDLDHWFGIVFKLGMR